jgi:uncharacterized radical SAM superfamily protein
MKKRIFFYKPSKAVYSISITGGFCQLQCGHCSGKFLSGMKASTTPGSLVRSFIRAKQEGARCILISGGFSKEGRLPITGFIDALREGKRKTGLSVEIHAGVLGDKEIESLGRAGVDALLLDVIGDQETISDYIGGTWKVRDYERIMETARKWIPIVAPHILVGVSNGEIKGEFNAVDMVAKGNVDALALLTLIDEDNKPKVNEVKKVMEYARKRVKADLTLGCMRSRGSGGLILERMAMDLGFDGVANPSKKALEYANSKGLSVVEVDGCCVFTQGKIPMSTIHP